MLFYRIVRYVAIGFLIAGMAFGLLVFWYLYTVMVPQLDLEMLDRGMSPWGTYAGAGLGTVFLLLAEALGGTLLAMLFSIDRDPFIQRNVLSLKLLALFATLMALCCFGTLFLKLTIITLLAMLGLLLCALLALVLAGLFQNAVLAKQENDLTI